MITIRPFDHSDKDYEAMVGISNAIWTDIPASAAYERRVDSLRLPEHLFKRLLVVLDEDSSDPGRPVAFGHYGHMPWSFHPHRFHFNIQVHPHYRRQGIGSALYETMSSAVRPYDPISVDANTREDQVDGRRFLENRGFELATRLPTSELDPKDFDPNRFAQAIERVRSDGIVIKSLAEVAGSDPDYLHKLYDLEWEAAQDIPWHDNFTPQSFEQYIQSYRDNPDLIPQGYQVALEEDRVVGLTQLWGSQATDAILFTGLTAVRRSHRRRGIATALKARAIGYAKTLVTSRGGPPVIRTDNEESNPMFQLNLRLGFREKPAWLAYRKSLNQEAAA